jgi:hypothetical protein
MTTNSHSESTLLHASDPTKPAFALDTLGSVNVLDMALYGSLIVGGTKAVHTPTSFRTVAGCSRWRLARVNGKEVASARGFQRSVALDRIIGANRH